MVKPTETLFIQNNPNKPFDISSIPNLNKIEMMWAKNEVERLCAVCSQQVEAFHKETMRNVGNFFSAEQKRKALEQESYWSNLLILVRELMRTLFLLP
jgi:delta-aminolevulinic acid dehydratase/porphobilinogen synthase